MSPVEVQVVAQKDDILVELVQPLSTQVQAINLSGPDVMAISSVPVQVVALKDEILVTVAQPPSVQILAASVTGMQVIAAGNVGPPGPPGQWISMTQAEYNALVEIDPDTLYVIVG